MRLYELDSEFKRIFDLIKEDGEIPDEVLEALNKVSCDRSQKQENICKIIRQMECDNVICKSEVDRIRDMVHSREVAIDKLKNYLMQSLESCGERNFETILFKGWIQNSPPSINFNGDISKLSYPLVRIKTEVDKTLALSLWKKGEDLPEGFEVKQGCHLRIK